MIITEDRPLSQMPRLLNDHFRRIWVTSEHVHQVLLERGIIELVRTDTGKEWLIREDAVKGGAGKNVLINGVLTPYFTPALFYHTVGDLK